MSTRVVMPKLTDTMEEGVVVKWKKHEGDDVASGDVLAEIETDKAVMDLEAFGSGKLRKLLAQEGETVKSGALIAVIAEPDEDIGPAMAETTGAAPSAAPEQKPARRKEEASSQSPDGGARERPQLEETAPKASPRAKTLAAERGIDLSTIKGSGPEGRIIERDLPETKAAAPGTAAAGTERPLSQMRKAIARTMVQSKAPVPHFYLTTDIAMDEAERLREQWKQVRRTHPSVTDLIVKAAALALMRHPDVNASFDQDKIRLHGTIDIGIAVGMEDGLLTPVVRHCERKTLEEIAQEAHALIERARRRQLKPDEYTGATFTVSNLGMYDVDNFIAVLVPPEAAALAVGAVRDVVAVEAGQMKTGRRMNVTLSCDHRALDGVQGAKFLSELKRILEHPLELMLTHEAR
jgi:pyruvate dehydrogenase E2 component (dihydrolipoamide acetyltransferase)